MISIIENIPALPDGKRKYVMDKKYTIAVAGTGYVVKVNDLFITNNEW